MTIWKYGRIYPIWILLMGSPVPPHQYGMKARLDRAQHMLVQTELSLAIVSEAAGFASQSHFSRAFRA
ncbi:MAG TPA: helix-turn-helix domain-containing protein [Sphingopyxis sp.]|nr:helix-turn-helix domain-containing protein [Sphingopyxis sp.]